MDTVSVLSDGEPSTGERVGPGAILLPCASRSRDLGLVLHQSSQGSSIPLLEEIFRTCDGQHIRL